jgi:predicted N-acyltransferase
MSGITGNGFEEGKSVWKFCFTNRRECKIKMQGKSRISGFLKVYLASAVLGEFVLDIQWMLF